MQHCTLMLSVHSGIDGWASLRKTLFWKDVDWVDDYKVCMVSAREENMKAIWGPSYQL